jgi:DNA-binding response OmpR family regulator
MTHRSTLKIVVADDNQDAALTLSMLLDRLGFQVAATAYDGATALECIRAENPQVAILDIALPELDGYEVARLVREEYDHPPRLIAVTGLGGTCDRNDALSAGFDAYFVKPVSRSELEAVLLALLPGEQSAPTE